MTWIPNYLFGNRMVSWLTNHSTNELLWTIWIPNQFAIQIPTVHWRFDCTHLNQQCDIQEWARATRARQRERDSWVVWEQRRRCRPPQGAWQSWTRVHRRRLPGEQSGTSNCKKVAVKNGRTSKEQKFSRNCKSKSSSMDFLQQIHFQIQWGSKYWNHLVKELKNWYSGHGLNC